MFRRFEHGRHARKMWQLAAVGACIHRRLSRAAGFQRRLYMHFDKSFSADHIPAAMARKLMRRKNRADANQSSVIQRVGHFRGAAHVLTAFLDAEAEVAAES